MDDFAKVRKALATFDRDTWVINQAQVALSRIEADVTRMREALKKIEGGLIDGDAPDVMTCTPETFRSGMWSWSQRVARAALSEGCQQVE